MTATAPLTIQRHSGGGRSSLALIGGIAALGALAATWLDWRLLVPIGLGLPLVALVVLDAATVGEGRAPTMGGWQPRLRTSGPEARLARWGSSILHGDAWLAGTFAALFFGASLNLIGGRRHVSAAASGQLSADNMVELAATMLAALVVGSAIRRGWSLRIPLVAQLFGGFAVLATFSVAWSRLPLFSAVRAVQFLVLAAFVAYCAARAAAEPGFVDRLLPRILRYLLFGVVALGLFGVLEGALSWERFAWRGGHPNGAAAMMLIVCMALLFHPRRAQITRPFPWWAFPLGLLPLIYATGSRANVAGAAVAIVCGWFVTSVRDKRLGALGVGFWLIVGGIATGFAADRLAAWLLRGGTSRTVTGLNGRVELWEWVLANPLGSEIWGVGIGAARGVLPVSWNPTNVHSAWIDVLQTLGVLGLAVMGALVVSVGVLAILKRSVHGAWLGAFVVVSSLNSVTISQPGAGLMLLCLAIVVVSDAGQAPPPWEAEHDGSARSDQAPLRTG